MKNQLTTSTSGRVVAVESDGGLSSRLGLSIESSSYIALTPTEARKLALYLLRSARDTDGPYFDVQDPEWKRLLDEEGVDPCYGPDLAVNPDDIEFGTITEWLGHAEREAFKFLDDEGIGPAGTVEVEDDRSPRGKMLDEANELVNGDRNVSYGDPNQDFRRTGDLWTTWLRDYINEHGVVVDIDGNDVQPIGSSIEFELEPHVVAVLMSLLKLSRIAWTPEKGDSWVDVAGYAACGFDCAGAEL